MIQSVCFIDRLLLLVVLCIYSGLLLRRFGYGLLWEGLARLMVTFGLRYHRCSSMSLLSDDNSDSNDPPSLLLICDEH